MAKPTSRNRESPTKKPPAKAAHSTVRPSKPKTSAAPERAARPERRAEVDVVEEVAAGLPRDPRRDED